MSPREHEPLHTYARTYDRDPDNNFAVACYEQNSRAELADAVRQDIADDTDIATWELASPQEWYDALHAALGEKEQDRDCTD